MHYKHMIIDQGLNYSECSNITHPFELFGPWYTFCSSLLYSAEYVPSLTIIMYPDLA